MQDFVHLHVHTQYSVLDGASPIKKLFEKAKADGQQALAITDHGVMFGVKEFLDTAKKFPEVKPIVGCEVYVAPNGRLLKRGKEDEQSCHLILLAKNPTGYHNLVKLCSLARIEGYYYRPRIDHELLQQYHEGLIVCSACLAGELPRLIKAGRLQEAEDCARWYRDLFGPDYYIELMRHRTRLTQWPAVMEVYKLQKAVEPHLIDIANKLGIKLIATNDVHFVNEEDGEAHDRLICVNTNADVQDNDRLRYTQEEFLKTREEMTELFADLPQALENTLEIAQKVEKFSIDHDPILPYFPLPEPFTDSNDYLRHLAYQGAERLYGGITEEVSKRLDYELHTIKHMGYPDYFLIVNDFIQAARSKGIWVGPGRGSAAGSAVAYCLGITLVDPIKYQLLFERFLNPDRISLPDIDIDFADDDRGKVLQYVEGKYGKDHVAHVVTFGTMAAKSAIKDVGRIQRVPLADTDRLCKAIPDSLPEKDGKSQKLTIENIVKYVPEIKNALEGPDPLLSSTIRYAGKLEGSVRNIGVHACAIIIGRDPLTDHIPITIATDKETGEDMWVSQYEGSLIESVGMLKMDFLGLKTLTILKKAVENVAEHRHIDIDLQNVPLDDALTYELFSRGDTIGIFQFESDGMRKWLRLLKPTRFDDIVAMTALYRPGPMDYIPDFVDRKNGVKEITYDLPCMEKYLQDTYGVTVYQEQVMLLSQEIAGFTGGQADTLRKAMGKKKIETMNALEIKFLEGGQAKGYSKESLSKIWTDWKAFAQYAFNKSHATCYSVLSYQTAYLKAHYPAEFMAAVLSKSRDNIDSISHFMQECKHLKLQVLGPDVNESLHDFTVNEQGAIRFGMAGIKGVGYGAVDSLIQERRKNGPFTTVYDLMERLNLSALNRKTLESLIYAGALDSFADIRRYQYFLPLGTRENLFLDSLLRYGTRFQEDKAFHANSLFGADAHMIPTQKPEAPKETDTTGINFLDMEKEMVGMYLSAHPLDNFGFELKQFCNCTLQELDTHLTQAQEIKNFKTKVCVVGGIVSASKTGISKKSGKTWGEFTLMDYSRSTSFRLFGKDYERFLNYLVKGQVLQVTCAIQERPLFGAARDEAEKNNGPREKEVRIQGMQLLANTKENIKEIRMILPLEQVTGAFCEEICKVFKAKRNQGKVNVFFTLIDRKHKLSLDVFSRACHLELNPQVLEFLENSGLDYKLA